MEVLSVEGITKSFRPPKLRSRPKPALRGLALEARRGEILGLVGPNGAGKTTFFRILLGLVRPDRGSGQILGLPLGHPQARRRMGYLPERFRFYPRLAVGEMLEVCARLAGGRGADARRQVRRVVERLGLEDLVKVRLGTLSKGWWQRLGLAQALVGDPQILVLDEPMSGLDPLGRAQVRESIAGSAEEGRTVILSSHILPDVEALAHRVALIADGRILETTSVGRLLEDNCDDIEIQIRPQGDLVPEKGRLAARDPDGWERWVLEGLQPGELERILCGLLSRGVRLRGVQPRSRGLEEHLLCRMGTERRRAA